MDYNLFKLSCAVLTTNCTCHAASKEHDKAVRFPKEFFVTRVSATYYCSRESFVIDNLYQNFRCPSTSGVLGLSPAY